MGSTSFPGSPAPSQDCPPCLRRAGDTLLAVYAGSIAAEKFTVAGAPMRTSRSLAAALAFASVSSVSASDPTGVYAVIDRVVAEPGSGLTDRLQLWGIFSLAR